MGMKKKLGKLHRRKRRVFEKGNRITSVQAILVGAIKSSDDYSVCSLHHTPQYLPWYGLIW